LNTALQRSGKGWIVIDEIRKCKSATNFFKEDRQKFQNLKHLFTTQTGKRQNSFGRGGDCC
jgi:hypothetical protein